MKTRWKLRCLLLALPLVLAFLTACGGHPIPKSSLDISEGVYTTFDADWYPVIQGVTYDDKSPFVPVNPGSGTAFDYAGSVIGYYVNDDRYVYYCEAEGLDAEEWLIKLTDDRRGHIQRDTASFVRATTVAVIPPWLKPVEG